MSNVTAPTQDLHQIGAVADRVGLSLRTIRHYDEVGLVVPSGRSAGGFRLYTDADVDLLARVKSMKPLGFSLDETREILDARAAITARSADAAVLARMTELAERASERCQELAEQLDGARSLTDELLDLTRAT
jgi:DNA-binding transcriptional MerR regulator